MPRRTKFNRAVIRQERFVKSLNDVRVCLDNAIRLVDSGHAHVAELLRRLDEEMQYIYLQAERLERDGKL